MGKPDQQHFVTGIATHYGKRLRRFLSLRSRNAADVADLAQEVFLRLLRVKDHGAIRSPEAYLFTVASHVVHQHKIQQATTLTQVEFEEVFATELVSSDDPHKRAALEQQVEQLQGIIAELPPKVAATLVLARVAGRSLEDISRQLGVSRESVKKYLARALNHCRERQVELEKGGRP